MDSFCGSKWQEVCNFPWEFWSFLWRPKRTQTSVYLRRSKWAFNKEIAHKIWASLHFKQNIVSVCVFFGFPNQQRGLEYSQHSPRKEKCQTNPIFFYDGVTSLVDGKSNRYNISFLQEGFDFAPQDILINKPEKILLFIYVRCQMFGGPRDYLSMIQNQHTRAHWEALWV